MGASRESSDGERRHGGTNVDRPRLTRGGWRTGYRALLFMLLSSLLAACSGSAPAAPPPLAPAATTPTPVVTSSPTVAASASVAPVAIRTFPVQREENGVPIACDSIGVENGVAGALTGDPADKEGVWLTALDGTRLSIVWPEGFTARFEPDVILLDEHFIDEPGTDERVAVVAHEGDMVLLQVERAAATGSFEDPYYASGIMLAGPNLDPDEPAVDPAFSGCYDREVR